MTQEDSYKLDWISSVPLWQVYNYSFQRVQTAFEQALQAKDILLVAETPTLELCGFAWAQPTAAFGQSYLKLIGVKEAFRRQGIASRLLSEIERLVSKFSHNLFLLVSDFNQTAQEFYERRGYEKIGKIPTFVLTNVDEYIYRKVLQEKEV